MIDLSLYILHMAHGDTLNGVYTELHVYENEFGFQVYAVEPEQELLETFETEELANQYIINYFN